MAKSMTGGYDLTDLASIGTRQINYNADNMPVRVIHSRYWTTNIIYDGEGGRAKKAGPSGVTYNTPHKLDRAIRWMVACRNSKEERPDEENKKDT